MADGQEVVGTVMETDMMEFGEAASNPPKKQPGIYDDITRSKAAGRGVSTVIEATNIPTGSYMSCI